jgi:hypothetical protein
MFNSINPTNKLKLVLITSSALCAVSTLFYLNKKNYFNSLKAYFSSRNQPSLAKTQANTNSSSSYKRNGSLSKEKPQKLNLKQVEMFDKSTSVSPLPSPARSNSTASSSKSKHSSARCKNESSSSNTESFLIVDESEAALLNQSILKCYDLNAAKLSIDTQLELSHVVNNMLLNNFKLADSKMKKKVIDLLDKLEDKSCMSLTSLVGILEDEYSEKNLDLFYDYKFDNLNGDASTDNLVKMLEVILAISENKSSLSECLKSGCLNETFIDLLFLYINNLEKTKNNVRRLRKIDIIRFSSIKILTNLILYANEALKSSDCNDTRDLIKKVLQKEPIIIAYDPKSQPNSLDIEYVSSLNMLLAYLELVKCLLGTYYMHLAASSSLNDLCLANESSFLNYILGRDFLNRINDFDRLNIEQVTDINSSIYDLLIRLQGDETDNEIINNE